MEVSAEAVVVAAMDSKAAQAAQARAVGAARFNKWV
jgi:hypothetical protein